MLKSGYKFQVKKSLILIILILFSKGISSAQYYRFGIYTIPSITWFSTDINEVSNEGSRAGFHFGLTVERYFSTNYAFTTGIGIMNAGGRLSADNEIIFKFKDYTSEVPAGGSIVYKIQYVTIPLGIKLKTNEIGYITVFTDLGLDPKVVVRGRVDIPSIDKKNENALPEIKLLNLGYHIHGGIEYSFGGTTAIIFGLGFENNFLDITKDTGDQIKDRVSHKFLKFILGVNF
jgi:hypothetical protein